MPTARNSDTGQGGWFADFFATAEETLLASPGLASPGKAGAFAEPSGAGCAVLVEGAAAAAPAAGVTPVSAGLLVCDVSAGTFEGGGATLGFAAPVGVAWGGAVGGLVPDVVVLGTVLTAGAGVLAGGAGAFCA